MTKLTKAVTRETTKLVRGLPVVMTIAPVGTDNETLISLRLKGKRTRYVCALSDIYRMAALWHGQKEQRARREARKNGVSWKKAKKHFDAENRV